MVKRILVKNNIFMIINRYFVLLMYKLTKPMSSKSRLSGKRSNNAYNECIYLLTSGHKRRQLPPHLKCTLNVSGRLINIFCLFLY